jgi:hypothetical protein
MVAVAKDDMVFLVYLVCLVFLVLNQKDQID